MKKSLLSSYFHGITDQVHGESYKTIIRLFLPEFVTAMLLYSLPMWLDAFFISSLKSTPVYSTLGVTNNLLHFITKMAEAFSVGTLIMVGQYNGMADYRRAGAVLRDAFWGTLAIGIIFGTILYCGAELIYHYYVPAEMVSIGVPFLRLRSLSVVLAFVYMALIGFLRGIKDTKTPMYSFIVGSFIFVIVDYALIFGVGGLPALGLMGSAWASIVQYIVMTIMALAMILKSRSYRSYGIHLVDMTGDWAYLGRLFKISWPVLIDKATLAAAYVWLCAMLKNTGVCGTAAFCAIRDLERFAIVPAIAFAQVITLLVSNDCGKGDWAGIKSNIKKVVFITSFFVSAILVMFAIWPAEFIKIFDPAKEFTGLAARVFPILSAFVFFDLLQLVLSGALRGTGNVKTVMYVRLAVCLGYFVPISYFFSKLDIVDPALKIMLIYGSFYVGNAIMSLFYIARFRGDAWENAS